MNRAGQKPHSLNVNLALDSPFEILRLDYLVATQLMRPYYSKPDLTMLISWMVAGKPKRKSAPAPPASPEVGRSQER